MVKQGDKENSNLVWKYREDTKNGNVETLIEICETNNLRITNGFYQSKDIYKYTWT